MTRVIHWLQRHENRMFCFVNQRIRRSWLNRLFSTVTHLGGATSTIFITLCFALLAQGSWRTAGVQSLIALAASHLPVALIKRRYPRLRPYMVLPQAVTGKNPLTDHSFPSGHTTAIFSITIPFTAAFPALGLALLPLAGLVALSRIYLGLHYPSDCLAGCLIGCAASLTVIACWGG